MNQQPEVNKGVSVSSFLPLLKFDSGEGNVNSNKSRESAN